MATYVAIYEDALQNFDPITRRDLHAPLAIRDFLLTEYRWVRRARIHMEAIKRF